MLSVGDSILRKLLHLNGEIYIYKEGHPAQNAESRSSRCNRAHRTGAQRYPAGSEENKQYVRKVGRVPSKPLGYLNSVSEMG